MTAAARREVAIGEGVTISDPRGVLVAPSVGASVALVLVAKSAPLAAMAHIMLPRNVRNGAMPFKFADTAVPLLIRQFEEAGGDVRAARIKMGGGARMYSVGGDSPMNIGPRNVEAIRTILGGLGLSVHDEDTGGSVGRTIAHELGAARTTVRVPGGGEKDL